MVSMISPKPPIIFIIYESLVSAFWCGTNEYCISIWFVVGGEVEADFSFRL
jgi:hypothetical protein